MRYSSLPSLSSLLFLAANLWAAPAAAEGFLYVTSAPAEAGILVDGSPTNLITPAQVALRAGRHVVTLFKQGHRTTKKSVTVSEGVVTRLELALSTPEQGPSRRPLRQGADATLTVIADVVQARIFVDGRATAQLTPATLTLAPGPHRVRVVQKDRAAEQAIVLDAGRAQVLRLTLAAVAPARPAEPPQPSLADRHRADPTWPARRDACWRACRTERRKGHVAACAASFQACVAGCPGSVAGKIVDYGAYYSCEGVCRSNRATCLTAATSRCQSDCDLRP